MRESRLKVTGENAHYHVIDRVIRRRFDLSSDDKEYLAKLMREAEQYTGCRILTYTILDNHMHTLLFVPGDSPKDLSDEEMVKRVRALSTEGDGEEDLGRLLVLSQEGETKEVRALAAKRYVEARRRHERRMHDVSEFVRMVKQRFSQWWNKRNNTFGHFWADRFKSVLVENDAQALATVAAYIDLNSVRAGIVSQPEDYRWSGYGEAVGGKKVAREGIKAVFDESDWRNASKYYRRLLFGMGSQGATDHRGKQKRTIDEAKATAVEAREGEMSIPELLRCRVRYFSDGLVFGSKGFVESVYESRKEWFGEKRRSGARKLKGGDWGELRVLRDLQRN